MAENTRYCFEAEWFDAHAQLFRKYEFFFYPSDRTIEMYDPKQRRTFLKRSKSDLILEDLFLGAAVNVHARQLLIRNFADEFTRKALSSKMESSLVILKPHAIKHVGTFLDILHTHKFTVSRMRYIRLDHENAYLDPHIIDGATRSSLNGGPSVVFEVLKSQAVESLQSLFQHEIPKKIPGASNGGLFYVPSHLKDAQTLLSNVFDNSSSTPRTATMNDCTLCIIRPHAIISGQSGKIIQDIIDEGFTITDLELFHLDKSNAEEFLEVYKGVVPEYHLMLSQLIAGPLIAMEVRGGNGPDTLTQFREFVGPSDPALAKQIRPNSIRAKYGEDKVKNAVHCTDLPEDGVLESEYFFRIL